MAMTCVGLVPSVTAGDRVKIRRPLRTTQGLPMVTEFTVDSIERSYNQRPYASSDECEIGVWLQNLEVLG